MSAGAILQKGEAEDQSRCPKYQQKNERQRAEITQKSFVASGLLEQAGDLQPWDPEQAVEKSCEPEVARHPAREDDGLKGVKQDDEDDGGANDESGDLHEELVAMLADLGDL